MLELQTSMVHMGTMRQYLCKEAVIKLVADEWDL